MFFVMNIAMHWLYEQMCTSGNNRVITVANEFVVQRSSQKEV